MEFYPEYQWEPDRLLENRPIKPRGYWDKKDNVMAVLDKAEQSLGITQV